MRLFFILTIHSPIYTSTWKCISSERNSENIRGREVYFQKVFARQSRVNLTFESFIAFLVISVENFENWPVWKTASLGFLT